MSGNANYNKAHMEFYENLSGAPIGKTRRHPESGLDNIPVSFPHLPEAHAR
jgi:hypothetical protein